MGDLFRETAAGQIIRFLSSGKLLQYPEELPGFLYQYPTNQGLEKKLPESEQASTDAQDTPEVEKAGETGDDDATTKHGFTIVDWYSKGGFGKTSFVFVLQ